LEVLRHMTHKQKVINKAHEIFKTAQETGMLPKSNSKEGQWIGFKRRAKAGNKRNRWYPELDEIAKQYGFPDAFDADGTVGRIMNQKKINKAHKILKKEKLNESDKKWIQKNKENPEIKKIAKTYREARKTQKILDKAHRKAHKKQKVLDKAHEVFKRAQERGLPKCVNQDYSWICTQRQAKAGKGCIWYPELDEIAKQYGFPNVFRRICKKQKVLDKAHEVFKRAQERGLPKYIDRFPLGIKGCVESQDYSWICTQRQSKAGKGRIWYPELDEMAKQYGFPNVFNILDKKQKLINKAHEVLKRAKEKGRLPKHTGICEEGQDYSWIKNCKGRAKAGRYPELNDIAKQYGFPNVFGNQQCLIKLYM